MTQLKEKSPDLVSVGAHNHTEGIDRNTYQGETIMKTVPIVPATRDIDWNGHTVTSPFGRTIRPNDLDMQILANGDQHAVGGSLNRADYFIVTAVAR
ncbi:hypothetical protein IWX78_000340 [Mycetocola sp. CAN_C7]|uniref:hypothetical protein n=1 Tax=Mycetocola sp. CAN_C7 TaxID=2787724 RepID=UPI0018CB10F1